MEMKIENIRVCSAGEKNILCFHLFFTMLSVFKFYRRKKKVVSLIIIMFKLQTIR